jgi:hypothetical protein
MLPQAYAYPATMRTTRDMLRRRLHLVRKRAERLTHLCQTNSQGAMSASLRLAGGVDEDTQQETRRITEEMALAAIEYLRAVIAVGPPFSVVFTVCASMMAAEGGGWRPMAVRMRPRS